MIPFPREETTPPVTNTYFFAWESAMEGSRGCRRLEVPRKLRLGHRRVEAEQTGFHPRDVLGVIDRDGPGIEPRTHDREADLECAELLEPLGALERGGAGRHEPIECRAAIRVEPDVNEIGGAEGSAREGEGHPVLGHDDLDDRRIVGRLVGPPEAD